MTDVFDTDISPQARRWIILGGTGFVGRHLLTHLLARGCEHIVYLVHREVPEWLTSMAVDVVQVGLSDAEALRPHFLAADTVINLLRPDGSGWFEPSVRNVLAACEGASVGRYIHVSSIDVYGGTHEQELNAQSVLKPISPYEKEHAAGERLVKDATLKSAVVVRLGAIFGVGGRNVVAFVDEIASAPRWKLALRRLLYGHRRMHLVSVQKVVDTLFFLGQTPGLQQSETVVITDDAAMENNFAYLQDVLMDILGRGRFRATPHLPMSLLTWVLRLRGVSNSDPMRRFHEHRLAQLGYRDNEDFAVRLRQYVIYLSAQE